MIDDDNYKKALIEKIKAETAEIQTNRNDSWVKRRVLIEVIIGSLITSGLLAAWVISYLSPILSAKNELALLSAEVVKKEAEYQQTVNNERTNELNVSIGSLTEKLNKTLFLNKKLQERQKKTEERLQKEKLEYSNIMKQFNSGELSLSSLDKGNSSLEQLTFNLESKVDNLQAEISILAKEQKEAKASEEKLERILTVASLNGLWKGLGEIDGKQIYIEFLPKGKVRTFAGIDGIEYIFGNQKWYLDENKVVIVTEHEGYELKSIGSLENGSIVGTKEFSPDSTMKWKLTRAR